MKIIHINASYKPAYTYGGPTMSVSKLCEELVKAGKEIEVLTTTANGDAELNVKVGYKSKVEGVDVTYFNRIIKGNNHFSLALLFSLWKKLKTNINTKIVSTSNLFTIVHIHTWWNLVSLGSCLVALTLSKKVILSPRGTLSNYSFGNRKRFLKNLFHQIIGKFLLKRCHFHVSSEKEKQDIVKLISPKSITVIPNFVELMSLEHTVQIPNSHNLSNKKIKLLFLSRIEEKKGLDILFSALKQVAIPFHLTIAGTGDPKYISFLKALAASLELTHRFSWIGQQDNEHKFSIIAAHDLLILPSHDESFANVVIESLSKGTPVIISKKVGLADYVKLYELGWITDNQPDNWADAINLAYTQKTKRRLIRKIAPKRIAEDFNRLNLLDRYIHMYESL